MGDNKKPKRVDDVSEAVDVMVDALAYVVIAAVPTDADGTYEIHTLYRNDLATHTLLTYGYKNSMASIDSLIHGADDEDMDDDMEDDDE